MKLFTINEKGKFVQFKEKNFEVENKEIDLEILLENNPEYFFDNAKTLIIGRQVTTNLNTFIDLLGVDAAGNTVVIELKRAKTPRETLAQLIEYASFVENLDYDQLNDIYQNYSGEEASLEEYHQQYFDTDNDINISWNKQAKLLIVAQDISPEIKQTSLFLRKKGIDVYCLEFKYFINNKGNRMLSSDFIVGEEEYLRHKVNSASQLPKTNKENFLSSVDTNAKALFEEIFAFADRENLLIRWGSKGFSLNTQIDNENVSLCEGYPPNSIFKQTIYTNFKIYSKVNNSDKIIKQYRDKLNNFGKFRKANSNLKWFLDNPIDHDDILKFIDILKELIIIIKKEGLNR